MGGSKAAKKATTRKGSGSQQMKDFVGKGKDLDKKEVPSLRAVLQQGILLKETLILEDGLTKLEIGARDLAKELAPLIVAQWSKSNIKFTPPVIISEDSLVRKVERMWTKVQDVARGRTTKKEKERVESLLDKLLDITTCNHTILLCQELGSGCPGQEDCKMNAHIHCDCPRENKIPEMELEWMFHQRAKIGEKCDMMMGDVDWVESEKQAKTAENKSKKEAADVKRDKKLQKIQAEEQELGTQAKLFMAEGGDEENNLLECEDEEIDVGFDNKMTEVQKKEAAKIVDIMLTDKLGDEAYLVKRFLDKPESKRNTMPVINTARASLRYSVSPAATAAIASEFLKDLIAAGHLSPEMAYLACDPSKLVRARKAAMGIALEKDKVKHDGVKITGMGYDGRKDKHTRAMVPDSFGKVRMRMIQEEHISVSEEPSGKYLIHFVPEEPVHPEKPALKTAQALYGVLEKYDSLDSLKILQGDSTNCNTGWRGGSHAHLEKLLGRKLFWGICNIHTTELPLRHLIEILDGPTSSDTGFQGPVCSLLSKVNEMEYNPSFKALPEGEDLIGIPKKVLEKMSTDQKSCYKLVEAVKAGHLPPGMQEMLPGKQSHARWLTTGQRLVFLWTRKHSLTGSNLKVLEMLVRFCIQWYFKLYFDIKVKHFIVDAPYHILTSLRILKTQPKKVRDSVSFYIRTGAWYAHSECVLLSLLASPVPADRKFAVNQILKVRGKEEFGDTSVRVRITPKLNLSAISLVKLISWKTGEVDEPVFTCSLSRAEIQGFLEKPYQVPEFSSHTQSTERCVKIVTEAAAVVCGEEARDGYIKGKLEHREAMPVFTTKKHVLSTF